MSASFLESLAGNGWWVLLGMLLGFLGSWRLGRWLRPASAAPVERIVERMVETSVDNPAQLTRIAMLKREVAIIPGLRAQLAALQAAPPQVVERIVEKIVDRPVERVVDRIVETPVDNPAQLARIATLEREVAVIPALRAQLAEMQAAPPQVVEKIVDRPVERVVDRIVETPVDNPAHLARIATLEREVAVIPGLRALVAELQAAPPQIVERIVEKIVDRPVERVVDRIVETLVDNPAQLARIATLEQEVAIIPGLRAQIAELQAAPPQVVERIVEKIVDRPVERVVERIVETLVDNPAQLARIATLEQELAVIPGLRAQLAELQAAPPQIVERIVEKIVDRPVERVVHDTTGIEERDARIREWRERCDNLTEELERLRRGPDVDVAAAEAAGLVGKEREDLEGAQGIGPQIAELIYGAGVTTFRALSQIAQSTFSQSSQEADAPADSPVAKPNRTKSI